MRVYISLIGQNNRHTIKDLTEKEFELIKEIASETETYTEGLRVEKIPERKELINDYLEFSENPKYVGWKKLDIIKEFVCTHYVTSSCRVMDFLVNEIYCFVD